MTEIDLLQAIGEFGITGFLAVMLIAERRRADAIQTKLDNFYAQLMAFHLGDIRKDAESK